MADPILFLDHAPALGGAEVSLLLLLKHLNRDRWQPHLACTGGLLAEKAVALGVNVHTLPMPRLRRSSRALLDWLKGVRSIARLVRHIGAYVMVANTVRVAFYAAPVACLTGVPFIWYMRDFWLSESRPRYLWADRLSKQFLCAVAARVIANSYATAHHLPCWSKVIIVYNGIEIDEYAPSIDGVSFRRQHCIPEEVPLVGIVGRLRPWKGQDRFLRVLARVREKIPETWGLVVGGAPFHVNDGYPQRLYLLASKLGLGSQVVFTGHLTDVRPALAAMDVFVHPGDPEPFGLVNIEAMAMGKPVVAFAHGALPEIVVDGETGLLVPPGDEDAMAEAIWTLLQNPAQRSALGNAGRERVQEYFTAHRMTGDIHKVLEEII